MCFYYEKLSHIHKNCHCYRKDKVGVDGVEPTKISDRKNTSTIATSEEELLLISEQNNVNLAGEESTWVVDSSALFQLTPNRESFSCYMVGDYDYIKMGNDNACKIMGIRNVPGCTPCSGY